MADEDKVKIVNLLKSNLLPEKKVKDFVCTLDPNYSQLFELWNNTSFINLKLNTVGIVLGAIYAKRRIGKDIDLNKWI